MRYQIPCDLDLIDSINQEYLISGGVYPLFGKGIQN
jgi:hypothetical protein